MDEIIFINHGRAAILGTYKKEGEDDVKVSVVELMEGSWFGDYQILFNMKSNWDLIAKTSSKKMNEGNGSISKSKIQVYKLDSEKFLQICNEHSEFRRYLLCRANLRRGHFIKVFQENVH